MTPPTRSSAHHPPSDHAPTLPGRPRGAAAGLPTADEAAAHTLLNCLLREVSGPERQTAVVDGHLLVRLPRRGVLLRVALRRASLLGAHRFTGPVTEQSDGPGSGGWQETGWRRLAEHIHAELTLRTGGGNDEFLAQVASSHRGMTDALASVSSRLGMPTGERVTTGSGDAARLAAYLTSEQSLALGHRFHPTPKARGGDPAVWAAYAPEAAASFPLRLLAVREELTVEDTAADRPLHVLDRLGTAPDGYRLLPAHPWQYALLRQHPALRAAVERADVLDLGPGRTPFTATASVRTVYDGHSFLKFSLNVRITNCVRKNAHYELAGAVALTRLLGPVYDDLGARFPGSGLLREPGYRSLAVPGADGRPELALLEGFGVIVREGLGGRLRPGVTPLLAAAVADEYPTGPGHVSRLLPGSDPGTALSWWRAYLDLLVPPVLAAYFDHGVVLEPHLQNVILGVDRDGLPVQLLFRDLEGTKLLPDHHARTLASLDPAVAGPLTYGADRGWDRVVYCLMVNHIAEMLAAIADLHPDAEIPLWLQVQRTLRDYAERHGRPPRLDALLAGGPLPAKANLLTRWARRADRSAGYVRLPSPLAPDVLSGAFTADDIWSAR
ncbi:IucA/IucC family protein [Streptomyces sp. SCSIO 30461]|uniref:IucA/IucC family protein n=1 Tax=Streptomyces sp. SCSIO 30461 TaxID=3118085 RepID=UPI0030D02ED0